VDKAVKLRSLPGSTGLAWKAGTLYATVAPGLKLVAYSGWNGSAFARKKMGLDRPEGLPRSQRPGHRTERANLRRRVADQRGGPQEGQGAYANSVISMRTDGTGVKTVATGLRQPWQLAFVRGTPSPYVTVLGQENLGKKQPPDYVMLAKDGDDYGFPACNWSKPAACASFAKPVALFPAHSSPTGITAWGSTLYVALFNGAGHGPEIVTIVAGGGARKPFLTGFAAPVVAVGASGRFIFAGDLTGSIYRVRS
jgi:glucose/arabinose dehydrogenase